MHTTSYTVKYELELKESLTRIQNLLRMQGKKATLNDAFIYSVKELAKAIADEKKD